MSLKKLKNKKAPQPPTLYKMKNTVICPSGFSLGISQDKGVFSYHVFKKHLNEAKIANQEILVNRVALWFLSDSLYAIVHLEGHSFEYLMGSEGAFCTFQRSQSVNAAFTNGTCGNPSSSELLKGDWPLRYECHTLCLCFTERGKAVTFMLRNRAAPIISSLLTRDAWQGGDCF